MKLKRLFDFSPQAKLWRQLAVFMFLFGLLAAVGNGFGTGKPYEGFLFALGFFVLPFVAALLGVAAVSEPYHLPRAVLWGAATGVLAGGSLAVSILLATSSEPGDSTPATFWFSCCFPLLLVALGVGVYFILRAWREARQETAKEREAQALELIQQRGVLALADLAAELALPGEEAEALVQDLIEKRTLYEGLFDAPRGVVYSAEALQGKLEQLTALVKRQPETGLADLAERLETPLELVHAWLRQLAQVHRIAGYLVVPGAVFHWLAREEWDGTSVCPSCGAAWALPSADDSGRRDCVQCGAEVFI